MPECYDVFSFWLFRSVSFMKRLLSYYHVSLTLRAQQAASQQCFLPQKRRKGKFINSCYWTAARSQFHLIVLHKESRNGQLREFSTYEKQLFPTYWTHSYIWQLTSQPHRGRHHFFSGFQYLALSSFLHNSHVRYHHG